MQPIYLDGEAGTLDECYAVVNRYVELLPKSLTDEPGYEILPGVQQLIERLRDHPDAVQGLGTGNVEAGGRVKLRHGGISDFFPFGGFDREPGILGPKLDRMCQVVFSPVDDNSPAPFCSR